MENDDDDDDVRCGLVRRTSSDHLPEEAGAGGPEGDDL